MPIYEYECPKCGRFDVLQKMSAKPLEKHDVCGSKVKKLISASAFAFKGSGFYITDYGKDGKKGAKADAPKRTQSDAGSSPTEKAEAPKSNADAKPASAPPSPPAKGTE